jgi:hypothetical protein
VATGSKLGAVARSERAAAAGTSEQAGSRDVRAGKVIMSSRACVFFHFKSVFK